MKRFDNILIIRTDRIGDVILTTPAIKALRLAYPMSRISILIVPSTKDLINPNPYLDEILLDERDGRHKGLIGGLQLARDLRQRNFDAVFMFHTKQRYNLICFLAGIPVRIGYKDDKYGFFLTHPIKDVRPLGLQHEVHYCLDILKKMNIEAKVSELFMATQKEAENWAAQWLSSQGINSAGLMAIHPGSSDPAKCWPVEKFARLIDALQQRYHLKIVLIGSPETKERSAQILQKTVSQPLDLTGRTSLAQTASFLRRCRILISNDSGPVHMAAAAGIHVISLFMRNDPGINPERWKPLSSKGVCLYAPGNGPEITEVLDHVEKIFHKDHQQTFHW